jgi:hypothetical protein
MKGYILRDLGIDGRMILKSTLKSEDMNERIDDKACSNKLDSQTLYCTTGKEFISLGQIIC